MSKIFNIVYTTLINLRNCSSVTGWPLKQVKVHSKLRKAFKCSYLSLQLFAEWYKIAFFLGASLALIWRLLITLSQSTFSHQYYYSVHSFNELVSAQNEFEFCYCLLCVAFVDNSLNKCMWLTKLSLTVSNHLHANRNQPWTITFSQFLLQIDPLISYVHDKRRQSYFDNLDNFTDTLPISR